MTVVYFSPLFESETHGYDTVDYFKVCHFCCYYYYLLLQLLLRLQ